MAAKQDKELLKRLREDRKAAVERARKASREQAGDIKKIKAALKGGGSTVPDLAGVLGMPESRVLWYVAALRKYGDVVEGEKKGDYYAYQLAC